MPHQQLSQNAPVHLQEALYERARGLPGVLEGPSRISVPGARAFLLPPEDAVGPAEAFLVDTEFGHIHPPHDGSLHLSLPSDLAAEVFDKGWGEPHPLVKMGIIAPTRAMVYGPRDEAELETVWRLLQASYHFARGSSASGGTEADSSQSEE